jgi:hypothetical protein
MLLHCNMLLHFSRDSREPKPVELGKENANMKTIKMMFVVAAVAVLGGCMVVPVAPGPYGGSPGYYAPAYYGPTIGFGIYGGGRGRGYR